jgi:UDP-N-acetylmuramate-alanine ligase
LYFEVDRKQHHVRVETSWLPNVHAVRSALAPLGFARADRGGTWSALVELDDFVGVVRRVTRALELLLKEATHLIASNEEVLETP